MKYNNDRRDLMQRGGEEPDLFESFFDDFLGEPFFPRFPRHEFREMEKMMKTDIKERENAYDLEVEMPGFKKEDINLDLKNGYLTISASKNECNDEKDKKGNFIRRERRCGGCSRSFYVGDIKEEDIDAKLEHGILSISVPKEKKQVETAKRITIK